MNSFDMNRFGKTIRWSLITEKKNIIKSFITLFAIYFLLIGANSGLFTGYRHEINSMFINQASIMCIISWIIAGGCMTSEIFRNLRKKQQRVAFFMLPATNAEKYCSRVVVVLGMSLILSSAALLVADWLNMLLTLIFTGSSMSTVAFIFSRMFSPENELLNATCMEGISTIILICWSVSSYILGGTLFRKVPVVLTTLAWNVAWIIFGIGLVSFLPIFADSFKDYTIEFWWGEEFTFELIFVVVGALFSVFNIWFSYRIFKRMDINANKLINI